MLLGRWMVFEDLVKVLTSDHEEINVGEGLHCGITWHVVDQTLLSEVLSLLQHLQDGVCVIVDQLNLQCKKGIGRWREERLQVNKYMHVCIYNVQLEFTHTHAYTLTVYTYILCKYNVCNIHTIYILYIY